jgi:hypothetical protein
MRAADADGGLFFVFSQITDELVGALDEFFGDEVEGGIVKDEMTMERVGVEDVVTLERDSKVWSDVFSGARHRNGG